MDNKFTIVLKKMATFCKSPFRLIIFGFMAVILLGALCLMLPQASRNGHATNFMTALFTATSAVCVTGLVVVDTFTQWSDFGHLIILLLIQIGGLGVVTVAGAFALLSMRRIGLFERNTMQEAMSAPQVGGIVKLLIFILKLVFSIELLGALCLAPRFIKDLGFARGIWYAVFHSVSAFCNAGFDLFGFREQYGSVTTYAEDFPVMLTLAFLIIIGGMGFLTWDDIRTNKWKIHKYKMQSKVILTMTAVLIILPFTYFFFVEFSKQAPAARFLASFFQTVTPRTAGFNSVDLSALSETGQGIITVLMLIGAAPGSTAGGIKVTTVAVLLTALISVWRRKEDVHVFKRRIDGSAVIQAAAVLMLYLLLFVGAALTISSVESLPLHATLFECASAIGTVGLSLGLTPGLGNISRLLLILLMFFGRVGGLTIIYATLSKKSVVNSRLPLERITVG